MLVIIDNAHWGSEEVVDTHKQKPADESWENRAAKAARFGILKLTSAVA